jgi:hypothetical protein
MRGIFVSALRADKGVSMSDLAKLEKEAAAWKKRAKGPLFESYEMFVVVAWKYPGVEILSPVLENLAEAKGFAEMERAKNQDYEQDILVLPLSDISVYEARGDL